MVKLLLLCLFKNQASLKLRIAAQPLQPKQKLISEQIPGPCCWAPPNHKWATTSECSSCHQTLKSQSHIPIHHCRLLIAEVLHATPGIRSDPLCQWHIEDVQSHLNLAVRISQNIAILDANPCIESHNMSVHGFRIVSDCMRSYTCQNIIVKHLKSIQFVWHVTAAHASATTSAPRGFIDPTTAAPKTAARCSGAGRSPGEVVRLLTHQIFCLQTSKSQVLTTGCADVPKKQQRPVKFSK